MRVVIGLLWVCVLAACQAGGYVGSGPIKFSESSLRNFDHYISRETPMSFAVTKDGLRSFYYYCPWNYQGHCAALADTQVVYECERRTGQECLVFAKGRDVVWDSPGNWRGDAPEGKFAVNHNQRQAGPDAVVPVPLGEGVRYRGEFRGERATRRTEGNAPGPEVCREGASYPVVARYHGGILTMEFDFSSVEKGRQEMTGRVTRSEFQFESNLAGHGSGFVVSGSVGALTIEGRLERADCDARFVLSKVGS
jgi:hypothetical protein